MKSLGMSVKTLAVSALAALVIGTGVANADQQSNKNLWRNLGIAGAVVAGHGLVTHNSTEALVGVAGAAYSANRYEQDRHHQSQDQQAQRNWAYNHRYANNGSYHHHYRTVRYYSYGGHEYRYNSRTGERTMVG